MGLAPRRKWAYPVEEGTQGVHLLGACSMVTIPG